MIAYERVYSALGITVVKREEEEKVRRDKWHRPASQSRSSHLVNEVERYHSDKYYGIWSELPQAHII